ncbi:MAG: polysaccharide biosynthesis tyrosine autokinase [Deltaproteobacteria bacterium]|nr:polysaccharide biosynthesis tyrosine autokinase [Deltaproteobacteria bacterium]
MERNVPQCESRNDRKNPNHHKDSGKNLPRSGKEVFQLIFLKNRWREEKMSKIYKALEKAEREREGGGHLPPVSEIENEPLVRRKESKFEGLPVEPTISEPNLVTFSQPGSVATEQFRKLRTHLLRLNLTDPPKTIMVTSATSGEGKTFVAANLAVNIATYFHVHALLVDCDLRNPQITKWFDLKNGQGLSDYLKGDGNLSTYLFNTEIEKLKLLPGGSIQNNPSELIGSKKMELLIGELRNRYKDRMIILDTTPLLATSEPEVLSKLVDGIIIVVRAGITPRETVRQAIASLEKEKIVGFVLNDLHFKSSALSSRYFGADGYYYKYGYGYGKNNSTAQKRWKKILPFQGKSEN